MRILVTGGAGFIGSNFVRYLLSRYDDAVVVLDKLTYAGNLENLRDLEGDARYCFIHGDIADPAAIGQAVDRVDYIVNFAAESHVDRSIMEPSGFITTDVYGPYVLLEAARSAGARIVHVSTDEVYGEVREGSVDENAPLRPRSPYSASKAGGELLVYAYFVTYGLPTLVTRGSNTFGPYQYPEKLIPVVITEALDGRPVPVYGDGRQTRDWLYVEDHCAAVDLIMRRGTPGEAYNMGGGNERHNIEVIEGVLDLLGRPRSLIQHVADRPGHDVRYSIDSSKLLKLGWDRSRSFAETLEQTVRWYVDHEDWWRRIKERLDYREYFERNYGARGELPAGREEPRPSRPTPGARPA